MQIDLSLQPLAGVARKAKVGALLRLGPEPLSVSWSNPSRGIHAAGLGVLQARASGPFPLVRWLAAPPSPPPGPWFGGWAFDASRPWAGFASERWVLPEVLAWWTGHEAWFAAFGPEGTSEATLHARLDRVEELDPRTDFTARTHRVQTPGAQEVWGRLIDGALTALKEPGVDKLVCARTIELESTEPFVERSILKALEARHPGCWVFLFRGEAGQAFLGASPETLCEVQGREFLVDALAGTAAKGQGEALLNDDKERREHHAVVAGIEAVLAPLAARVHVPTQPSIKRLTNVEHLHTPITGTLRPEVTASVLARALHPTPAVAGTPTAHAVRWLREHEGFSRGWYCGAIGAVGPDAMTLAVGLRSALVHGAKATLFVGAGVVEGSTAAREWNETERKALALLPALGVNDG